MVGISKATNIKLDAGKYDCCGSLFFKANGMLARFGIAAQIEFLLTLQDSLLDLTDEENSAFNILIDMLYEQKQKMAA